MNGSVHVLNVVQYVVKTNIKEIRWLVKPLLCISVLTLV